MSGPEHAKLMEELPRESITLQKWQIVLTVVFAVVAIFGVYSIQKIETIGRENTIILRK